MCKCKINLALYTLYTPQFIEHRKNSLKQMSLQNKASLTGSVKKNRNKIYLIILINSLQKKVCLTTDERGKFNTIVCV